MGFFSRKKQKKKDNEVPQATEYVDPKKLPSQKIQEDLKKLQEKQKDLLEPLNSTTTVQQPQKPKKYGLYDPTDSLKLKNPFKGE